MAAAAILLLLCTVGCSGFFPPIDNTPTPGSSGNYVYVGNATTSNIAGFSISSTAATLTAVTGSPFTLGYVPLSMAVTPANTFLYVGGISGIYLYVIGSGGVLTAPSTGAIQQVAYATAMTVSPDGNWLLVLDGSTQVIDIYQVNTSTGALTVMQGAQYNIQSGAVWKPSEITISPGGSLIFAALGTAGDAVFTFNTSTGVAVSTQYLSPISTSTGDNALAVNPAGTYLFIARSGTGGGVAVYSIGTNGLLSPVSGSPFAAGTGPSSITIDSTGTYVYTGNRGDGTISGYTITAGTTTAGLTLTALADSPYQTGTLVQSIGIDSTKKYLLAAAQGGSPDLTMYSFDTASPGKLNTATSVATGTDPTGAYAVALTH